MAGAPIPAGELPTQALAYLGDALFELHVRRLLVQAIHSPQRLHRAVVERVRAGAQARVLQALEPALSEAERDLVRRARNAYRPQLKRLAAPQYRHSTAFEALLGHLYLTGQLERLAALLADSDRLMEDDRA